MPVKQKKIKSEMADSGFISLFIKIFCVFFLIHVFMISCRQEKVSLPDPKKDYKAYIVKATGAMCEKMLGCYEKINRNVSPEFQKLITKEKCTERALKDLDEKLSVQTPTMLIHSVSCYDAILDTDCKEMGLVSMYHPSCISLRDESNKVYANLK